MQHRLHLPRLPRPPPRVLQLPLRRGELWRALEAALARQGLLSGDVVQVRSTSMWTTQ